jgi:NAD(P)-dependent dehydrogenase (short-subunit alcohol dehydrogenase family)
VSLPADLADEVATEALVPNALAALGRLDAVVNSASRFEHDTIDTLTYAAMDAHWRANTAAGLVLARALHLHCQAQQRQGCVVNLLDQKLWAPNPDHLSYTLSKAALAAATPILAQALAPWVRVVGVAPGLTLGSPDIDGTRLAQLQAQTPLRRGVMPDDIARTVQYLLDTPSITGTSIVVDAGSHLTRMSRDFAFLDTP